MSNENVPLNFMSGSPLNRLSWLRPSAKFINACAVSPQARWLLYRSGDPLVDKRSGNHIELPTRHVDSILGPKPYFGQTQAEGESGLPDVKLLEGARFRGPTAVFLGVWENDDVEIAENIKGRPYFALDISNVEGPLLEQVHAAGKATASEGGENKDVEMDYVSARAAASRFSKEQGAIFAAARAMLEWNSRTKFCASCGSPVYSMWSGWKLSCTSLLPWAEPQSPPCPTHTGLHSHQYPRTDTAIITGVIDRTGDKILLGRNKKFPGLFYSTLAGFVEPGETFEEAVAREIYEESGVKVFDVAYHSVQPWPYPGNLMVGFYARADSNEPIKLDLDTELSDAKWFTRAEVTEVLEHPDGTKVAARDHKTLDNIVSGKVTDGGTSQAAASSETTSGASNQPPFRVPPRTSIAGTLIAGWAYGKSKL
ncbi:hypothetical protein CPB86DRAFT_443820 [Serendipita vermifera]|nr:hypothetical protein CPB86DRAFT_443820 [Serendipita vermifera]